MEIWWGEGQEPTKGSALGPRQPPAGAPSEPLPLDSPPNQNPGAANDFLYRKLLNSENYDENLALTLLNNVPVSFSISSRSIFVFAIDTNFYLKTEISTKGGINLEFLMNSKGLKVCS